MAITHKDMENKKHGHLWLTCFEFQSGFGYTCSCPAGYVGTNCETRGESLLAVNL